MAVVNGQYVNGAGDANVGGQYVQGTAQSIPDGQPGNTWQDQWKAVKAPDLNSINPAQDMSYDSFLRGMGLQQSQIGAQKARQSSYLDQQLADQRPLWADQLRTGLKGISDSAENNGMFRSGARLQNQDEFAANQGQQQTAYENGIHRQQSDLGASAQDQLMSLAQQQAEQQLAARQRIAQSQVSDQVNPTLLQFVMSHLGPSAPQLGTS